MYCLRLLIQVIAFLSISTSAGHVPRNDLVARGDVDTCKAILIALKASAFCSSFVPIKDVTVTETQTGTAVQETQTVTAPCTNPRKKRQISTTADTRPLSTTPRSTPATTSSASSKCSIKAVPLPAQIFACDVITKACVAFVTPKTVKTSTFKPGPTTTEKITVTPTCPQTTTRIRETTPSTQTPTPRA